MINKIELQEIISNLDSNEIEDMIKALVKLRHRNGRLFCIGVGGGAANASHAVNDFRKICEIEAYASADNIAELTARANDEGWETIFIEWLKGSKFSRNDALFVFSVSGGSFSNTNMSLSITRAVEFAYYIGVDIFGIVGDPVGVTAKMARYCIVIPNVNDKMVTAYTESFQSVICHLMVMHPDLQMNEMRWESVIKVKGE